MRLTLWTDYALRTLMYVGVNDGRLATIAEISAAFGVSKAHLMKVVNKLARLGYLETVRGKNGGIKLGRPPAAIGVGAVVRDTEEELAVMGCLSDSSFCPLDGCCVLKHALGEASLAFLRVLDRYTLADLLAPREALAAAIGAF
ncbi:MAG: Rrf2 family transcriptional regulator [Alphaproteobacteria bacterium]|nr:Rrf2 family transcriptional regulator [Alphaproteobacteria bacterium]